MKCASGFAGIAFGSSPPTPLKGGVLNNVDIDKIYRMSKIGPTSNGSSRFYVA